MVTLARFGVAMSTSRGSDLDDADDNSRKCQDRTDRAEDDGYRERVQVVGRGGRGRVGSESRLGNVGRASGRPKVRAKHIGEVKGGG
jgi:hypothetical protein